MFNRKTYVLISTFYFLVLPRASAQCAMCRAVLESEENQGVAEGINDGIMYLMVWPYVLVGIVGYIVYRMYRSRTVEEE